MLKQVLTIAAVISAAGAALYPGLPSANDAAPRPSGVTSNARHSFSAGSAPGAYSVPLFPSASDPLRQGFVRVINRSDQDGEVTVAAIDDGGNRVDGAVLAIGANETAHFNSGDLENGKPEKGLSGGTGAPREGDWRLELASDLDIEVLAYIRTTDGFLTAMHDVVERGLTGRSPQAGERERVHLA